MFQNINGCTIKHHLHSKMIWHKGYRDAKEYSLTSLRLQNIYGRGGGQMGMYTCISRTSGICQIGPGKRNIQLFNECLISDSCHRVPST